MGSIAICEDFSILRLIYSAEMLLTFSKVGILTRCLFGLSIGSLAQEISRNTDGKWDCIYAE